MRTTLYILLLICLVTAVVYTNGIPGQFVFDDKIIERDPRILGQTSFWTIFVTPYWYLPGRSQDLYRPLTTASYAINHAVVGLWSPGFHIVNVALHALVSCLLVVFLDALLRDRALATISGLLFAVHPVHTEAVTGIVGRAEALAALFLLVALVIHVRDYRIRDWGRALWLPVGLVCFFAALLSKETAIVAPGLLLLADYVKRIRDSDPPQLRWISRSLLVLLLYAGVAALSLLLRYVATGEILQIPPPKSYYLLHGHPWTTYLFTGLSILAVYARLLFFPLTLSADYSYRQVPLVESLDSTGSVVAVCMGLMVAAGLIAVVWASKARSAPVLLAVGFFVVSYSVVSNLLVPIGVLVAERLMYLPSVGFCVGLAWGGLQLARKTSTPGPDWWRRIGLSALVVLLTLYGARTVSRNFDWLEPETLYVATAQASPDCHAAHYNYAAILMNRNPTRERNELALQHLLRAQAIRGDHYPSLVNLALVYSRLGRPAQAREVALRGLQLRPDSPQLRNLARGAESRNQR